MKNPAASLYDDVALIDGALEPFNEPVVNEHPGLRWMRQTLVERREHVMEQIETVERSTLTVAIAPVETSTCPSAAVAARVLTAVQRELHDAATTLDWPSSWPEARRAAAVTLELGHAGDGDGPWSLELRRPAGPLTAQPTMPDGARLVFDAAVDALLDRVEDGGCARLARLVVDIDLPLTLTAGDLDGRTRTVQLDQQHAQHLLLET